jgi:hypothetical protein
MRNAGRSVLSVVFVTGLVLFFAFGFQMRFEGTGEAERKSERYTIGWPWPWLERRTETAVKPGEEKTTRSDHLRLDSPAWLVLLATIGVGYGVHRLRPRPAEGRV